MVNPIRLLQTTRKSQIYAVLVCAALAIVLGTQSKNLRVMLAFFALVALIFLWVRFNQFTFLFLLALCWWIPVDIDRLFPLETILGPWFRSLTAPEIVAYVGLLAALVFDVKAIGRIIKDPVLLCLLLLILGGSLAAFGIETNAGMTMFRRSTFFFAAVILLYPGHRDFEKKVDSIFSLVIFSGMIFMGYILFVEYVAKSLFVGAGHYEGSNRLGGIYSIPELGSFYFGPNNIAIIVSILAVMALTRILLDHAPRTRLMMAVVLVSTTAVLLMTGSRASINSALITGGILLMTVFVMRKQVKFLLYGLVLAALIAFVTGVITTTSQIAETAVVERINHLFAITNDPYGSFQTRMFLFEKGIDLFLRNPGGIGYGTFVTLNNNDILWEQNLLLNTALGGGVLGLIGLLGFFALLFTRGIQKIGLLNPASMAFLAGSLSFFINSMFTDPNVETVVYFSWLILGVAYACVSTQSTPATPGVFGGSIRRAKE